MALPPLFLHSRLLANVTTTFELIKKHVYLNSFSSSGNWTIIVPIAQYGNLYIFLTSNLGFSKLFNIMFIG